MQRPLVTIEGHAPKRRLHFLSALIVCGIELILPFRLRLWFTVFINFVYNHVFATFRLFLALLGRGLTRVMVWLSYFAALAPTALLARALGRDYLRKKDSPGSFFLDKEPADEGEERFLRQF